VANSSVYRGLGARDYLNDIFRTIVGAADGKSGLGPASSVSDSLAAARLTPASVSGSFEHVHAKSPASDAAFVGIAVREEPLGSYPLRRRGWMKVVALIAVGLAVVCLPAGSTAWAQQPYSQYYDYVSKVSVGNDSFLYIAVGDSFNLSGNHGCTNLAFARSMYTISDDRTKAQLQIALASFLSRNRVWVQTTGCVPNLGYDYAILTNLQVCDSPSGLCHD
jgi:hypothetical protein